MKQHATRTLSEPDAPAFDPWRRLAAATFTQAVRDYHAHDFVRSLDAALWIVSPAAELFLDVCGMEVDPARVLTLPKRPMGKRNRR